MAKASSNIISFKCARCGAKLKVNIKFANRFIDCPKCSQKTPVPGSQEEADEEMREYTVNTMAYEVPPKCTKCGKKIAKGAVVCIGCGFDYRKGKQLLVEDDTVKEGDKTRGGPALKFMMGEMFLVAVLVGALTFRANLEKPEWWELGLYIGGILALLAFIPKHFIQWNDYKRIPMRDTSQREIEDRAERTEAQEPYGSKTAPVFVLCAGAGVGLGYLIWGMGESVPTADPANAPAGAGAPADPTATGAPGATPPAAGPAGMPGAPPGMPPGDPGALPGAGPGAAGPAAAPPTPVPTVAPPAAKPAVPKASPAAAKPAATKPAATKPAAPPKAAAPADTPPKGGSKKKNPFDE